jgi:hypothetical protein
LPGLAGVAEVCHFAVKLLAVTLPQRQPPHGVTLQAAITGEYATRG